MRIIVFILMFCLMPFLMPAAAKAQAIPGLDEDLAGQINIEDYKVPDFVDMAELYWVYGIHDVNNNFVMDEYIELKHCDLHQEFFDNEFEWAQLREAVRGSFNKNVDKTAKRFRLSVFVDRYDFGRKGFPLQENARMTNVGLFTMLEPAEAPRNYCGDNGMLPFDIYPHRALVKINNPFDLELIRMPPEEAEQVTQAFVMENAQDRVFLMDLFITINGFDAVQGTSRNRRATFVGTLDEARIYFDDTREQLLYSFGSNPPIVY